MNQASRDLIPLAVRFAVIDTVGGWGIYTVRQIDELFRVEGFEPEEDFEPSSSGARRGIAEQFQAAIDFASPEQAGRYLRVVEQILDDHGTDAYRDGTTRLVKALRRAGIERDGNGRLQLPPRALATSATLSAIPTESDIRLHAERLDRLDQPPEELIGAAKELVEATAKYVLLELGETVGTSEDLPALSKRALRQLKLHPEAIAPTTRGAEVMTRLLGGLAQVAGGLAELRNMGYGTGHGRGRRVGGIKLRHAEFAARSAVAYATFVLDTLADDEAPWRQRGSGSAGA